MVEGKGLHNVAEEGEVGIAEKYKYALLMDFSQMAGGR